MVTEVAETIYKTGKKIVKTELNEVERAAEQGADNGNKNIDAGYKTAKNVETALAKTTNIAEKIVFNYWKEKEKEKCQDIEF